MAAFPRKKAKISTLLKFILLCNFYKSLRSILTAPNLLNYAQLNAVKNRNVIKTLVQICPKKHGIAYFLISNRIDLCI